MDTQKYRTLTEAQASYLIETIVGEVTKTAALVGGVFSAASTWDNRGKEDVFSISPHDAAQAEDSKLVTVEALKVVLSSLDGHTPEYIKELLTQYDDENDTGAGNREVN